MSLSKPMTTVFQRFEGAFSQPPWHKVQVLLIGPLSARGRQTVAAALRQMGLHNATAGSHAVKTTKHSHHA
jgi:hypothetical protein